MAENVKHIDEAKEKAKQAAEATGKAVQERLQTARDSMNSINDTAAHLDLVRVLAFFLDFRFFPLRLIVID